MPIDFADLPSDPEDAFIILEPQFRAECERGVSQAGREDDVRPIYLEYLAKVLGAIE